MTTATANRAPTEAEIRQAVKTALERSRVDVGEWVHDLAEPINYVPAGSRGEAYHGALWDDLRPTEADYLDSLLNSVYARSDAIEDEVTAKIEELVVEAALTFAREFPDAPRAVPE